MIRFFQEIFQDDTSGYSAKRTGFFVFIALIVVLVVASLWKLVVSTMIWNGLVDLVKWIGTAILAERAPAMLAAARSGVVPGKPEEH